MSERMKWELMKDGAELARTWRLVLRVWSVAVPTKFGDTFDWYWRVETPHGHVIGGINPDSTVRPLWSRDSAKAAARRCARRWEKHHPGWGEE